MLPAARKRAVLQLTKILPATARRANAFSTTSCKSKDASASSKTSTFPIETQTRDASLKESAKETEHLNVTQAPNRATSWSRSQKPRAAAMTGPRFEQTIMELQPAPYAAIELIHKQPVRWVHERTAVCDGGGGPLGHPRIFINTDKPQICMCEYCGLPYANEHHRKHIESLPEHTYPLAPVGDTAEVPISQRITDEALGQR